MHLVYDSEGYFDAKCALCGKEVLNDDLGFITDQYYINRVTGSIIKWYAIIYNDFTYTIPVPIPTSDNPDDLEPIDPPIEPEPVDSEGEVDPTDSEGNSEGEIEPIDSEGTSEGYILDSEGN